MKKILFSLLCCVLLAACSKSGNVSTDGTDSTVQEVESVKVYTDGYAPDGTIHEMDADRAAAYVPGVSVPQLTIIDFNATWCIPCRQLTPILEQLASEYEGSVTFVACDVDNYGQLFEDWDMGSSIPAMLFISTDGNTDKLIGLCSADEIRAIIDSKL